MPNRKISKNTLEKILPVKGIFVIEDRTCSVCKKSKELLTSKNISFKKVQTNNDIEDYFQKKYKKKYPYVPKIIVDNKFIGGYEDLVRFLKNEYKEKTPKHKREKKNG